MRYIEGDDVPISWFAKYGLLATMAGITALWIWFLFVIAATFA